MQSEMDALQTILQRGAALLVGKENRRNALRPCLTPDLLAPGFWLLAPGSWLLLHRHQDFVFDCGSGSANGQYLPVVLVVLDQPARIRRRPQVALLVETSNAYSRGLLVGIRAYMREGADWEIHFHRAGVAVMNRRPGSTIGGETGLSLELRIS